ncbi:hypothetical protein Ndes2526B_g01318 [Nannochloris sp. 'desiccata']|nr:hypothetical protein KSW81_004347 [Chlorella desiccata (nom. nud.)]KAH7624065.1 hypothetical protein NADE_008877 [Chlorella desiccata (nom. nud.)]
MASIVRFTASWVSNLAAKLVYSTVEGYAFLFSKYGASVVFGAEAALLLRAAGTQRALATGLQAATACIIGRGVWAFFHAAQASHRNNAMKEKDTSLEEAMTAAGSAASTAVAAATQSIWDWEPPSSDQFASGAWHVLRELVVTATKMQELYPEISTLMALPGLCRPEELTSRLYYLYVASENASVSDYDLSDGEPVPESMLESLRAMRPFAMFAYDCPTDAVLSDALITRGFRLLAAKYEPDITSGCPAYYLAMSTTSYSSGSSRTASVIEESSGGATGGDGKNIGEVILCIRGTYSPEDVFTDLLMVGVAFGGEEESTTPTPVVSAHAGMAKAALFLVEKFGPMLCMLRDSGMKVTLIGHSLGAGVASIVALHLKQRKYGFNYSTLQCFAFEPPACLDLPLAEACSDVVLSMVHADDIVPRMAAGPFSAFLQEVAQFDWQAEANKEGNALPAPLAVMHKLAGLVGSKVVAESASTAAQEDSDKDTEVNNSTIEEKKKKELKKKEDSKYNPFVPGKVVWLSSQPQGQQPVQMLLKPASPVLRRIRLTSSIISDHFIDKQACMMALGEMTTS